MEDKLITLSILTYSKAQILKSVLESEGIESYIHNVNLIQPVISSGVRVRIKESDLPRALKIIESSSWLSSETSLILSCSKRFFSFLALFLIDIHFLQMCSLCPLPLNDSLDLYSPHILQ